METSTTSRTPKGGSNSPVDAPGKPATGQPTSNNLAIRALPFLNSDSFALLSWKDRQASGLVFGIGLAAFLAYDVFSYTLPGILTQLAFLTLGYSAAVHAVSTLDAANKLPPQLSFLRNPPQLPFDAEKIRQFGGMIGERAVGIINKANTLLRWSSPAASGRALAYAWLAYQYNYLLSPAWMLLFWLMAFAAAPAYLMFQRDVEKILSSQALPILQKVQASYSGVSSVLIDAYRKNAAVFPIIVAGVAALFLYVTWGIWSFSSLFTLGAMGLAATDLLAAATDGDKQS